MWVYSTPFSTMAMPRTNLQILRLSSGLMVEWGWSSANEHAFLIYAAVLFSLGGAHFLMMSSGVLALPVLSQFIMMRMAARKPHCRVLNWPNAGSVCSSVRPCHLLAGLCRMFNGLLFLSPRGSFWFCVSILVNLIIDAKD